MTKEQRRKNMTAIKSRDTKIELQLRRQLWSYGVRYRVQDKSIIGKPDISIKKYQIAVFCDSEFWHGKEWTKNKRKIKSNREYWFKKIEGNIKRDRLVTRELKKSGWTVIRFWAKEIQFNREKCISIILKAIENKKQN